MWVCVLLYSASLSFLKVCVCISSLKECINALIFQNNSSQISPLIPSTQPTTKILLTVVSRLYSPHFLSSISFPFPFSVSPEKKEFVSLLFINCLCLFTEMWLFSRRSILAIRWSRFLWGKSVSLSVSAESPTDQLNVKCILMHRGLRSAPEQPPPWHFLTQDYNWLVRVAVICTGTHLARSKSRGLHIHPGNSHLYAFIRTPKQN